MKSVHQRSRDTRHVILLFIPIILFAGVLVLAGSKLEPVVIDQLREHRINQLYTSIHLDSTYLLQSSTIFGDKRVVSPGRTQASSAEYVRGATVSATTSDLKQRIEADGFSFIHQEYPGSASPTDEFKDHQGEYIRVTVSSKPRDDAITNKILMKQTPTAADYDMDINAGPSSVTIKINLDDNNE